MGVVAVVDQQRSSVTLKDPLADFLRDPPRLRTHLEQQRG
jgi:hypothetical protein